MKELRRSKMNRMLGGVCAGIGKYVNVDPTVIRLIWVVTTLLTTIFPGLIAYFIAWVVIPEDEQEGADW